MQRLSVKRMLSLQFIGQLQAYDLNDQKGGYKLLYYTRHNIVQTKVLISLESVLRTAMSD